MKIKIILETERLILRELTHNDYNDLEFILQDKDVMYAYEHAFSDDEVLEWLNRQIDNYNIYGFGLWAVILKYNNKLIGQFELTLQNINETTKVIDIGYLFNKSYWKNGYAIEYAKSCKDYAFNVLNKYKVYSIIRENNILSQKVAIRNCMEKIGEIVKFYCDMNMIHYIYCATKLNK